jgi:hypothetical protein
LKPNSATALLTTITTSCAAFRKLVGARGLNDDSNLLRLNSATRAKTARSWTNETSRGPTQEAVAAQDVNTGAQHVEAQLGNPLRNCFTQNQSSKLRYKTEMPLRRKSSTAGPSRWDTNHKQLKKEINVQSAKLVAAAPAKHLLRNASTADAPQPRTRRRNRFSVNIKTSFCSRCSATRVENH